MRPLSADEALGPQGEGLLEVVVAGVAETGELGARTHRAQNPPHPAVFFLPPRRAHGRSPCPSEALRSGRRCRVGKVGPVRAEGVGFDRVDSHGEVRVMDVREDMSSRGGKDLVAAFQLQEVGLERQVPALRHGAHRPIGKSRPGSRPHPAAPANGRGGGRSRYQAQNEASKQTTGGA